MARAANPFSYQDPSAGIAAGLAQAIFGNPDMAAKQEQMRAEMEQRQAQADEARAHARLYGSQATGQDGQNGAAASLPAMIAALAPQPRAAPPETLDGFLSPDYQPQPQQSADEAFRGNIGNVIAAMAQAQGDKMDTGATVGSLASFLGGDELARRGMVAQGKTPGAEFALTPERADAIAQQGIDGDYRQATGVATINHASDLPVANIRAGADRDVARIKGSTDRDVAGIKGTTDRDVAGIRGRVKYDNFGIIADVLPGARETGGWRSTQRNAEVGGVSNSYHLGRGNVQAYDIAPIPGMTFEQAKARFEQRGVKLVEAQDETNRPGHGPHWHFAVEAPQSAGRGTATKAPKALNASALKMVDAELQARLAPMGGATETALNLMRARAATLYQATGNPVASVQQAIKERKAEGAAINARKRTQAGASASAGGVERWERVNGKLQRVGG